MYNSFNTDNVKQKNDADTGYTKLIYVTLENFSVFKFLYKSIRR